MNTNGARTGIDTKAAGHAEEAPSSLNGQSVEERLEALRQTIRTWDWRAAVVEAGPPPVDVTVTAAPLTTTAVTELDEDSGSPERDSSPLPGRADAQPLVIEPTPRPVEMAPPPEVLLPPVDAVAVPAEGVVRPAETAPAPVETLAEPSDTLVPPEEAMDPLPGEFAPRLASAPPPEGTPGEEGVDGSSWLGQEHEPEPEPERPVRRFWSNRLTKVAVLGLAALVVVVLIIGGIRLFAKSPASPGPTATRTTQPSHRSVHHGHFVAPISAAELTQYQGYATALQNANLAAIRGFEKAGSTPTASQVVLVVSAYRTAVNDYYFQLHFIHWPQSMQTAIESDYAQLQALVSFLQAFPFVAPNGVPAWLSQLHNRTGTTQTADNAVRQDLGLPASVSFP